MEGRGDFFTAVSRRASGRSKWPPRQSPPLLYPDFPWSLRALAPHSSSRGWRSVRADASERDEEAVARWIDVAAPRERLRGDNARRGGSILRHRHCPRRLAERVSETSRARWRLARRRRWARRPPRGPAHSGVTSWRVVPPPGARRPVASSPRAPPRGPVPQAETARGDLVTPSTSTDSTRVSPRPSRARALGRASHRAIMNADWSGGSPDGSADDAPRDAARVPEDPTSSSSSTSRSPSPSSSSPSVPAGDTELVMVLERRGEGWAEEVFPTSSSSAVPWRPRPRRRGERSARTRRVRTSSRDSDSPRGQCGDHRERRGAWRVTRGGRALVDRKIMRMVQNNAAAAVER